MSLDVTFASLIKLKVNQLTLFIRGHS